MAYASDPEPALADTAGRTAAAFDWRTALFFVATHAVAVVGPFYFSSWPAFAAAFGLYVLTTLFGITLGYHRLLAHRSFKTHRSVERILATIGLLAVQGSPVEWVGVHRMHHAYGDTAKDPHDARRGFWWSHLGWMLFPTSDVRDVRLLRKFSRDVAADPYIDALTGVWPQLLLQLLLGLCLGFAGGLDFVVWGIFVRCVFVYHITWSLNSFAHKFGYKSHDTADASTNNWGLALLTFGEGWHNNHHAQPSVARAGRAWWEIDLTYAVLKVMVALGMASDVKQPAEASDSATDLPLADPNVREPHQAA